jgi:hypothetical protein
MIRVHSSSWLSKIPLCFKWSGERVGGTDEGDDISNVNTIEA